MAISYRTRRFFRRLSIFILTLVLLAVVLAVCWFLWLDRYVIYTSDGAKLDFELSLDFPAGQPALRPSDGETVQIYYPEDEVTQATTQPEEIRNEMPQMDGFYISFEMLRDQGIDTIKALIAEMSAHIPIMVDVKIIKGEFLYSSVNGHNTDKLDLKAMDDLIAYLSNRDHYLIARMPAFRDYWFGLYNVALGLQKIDGRVSLWMDEARCYWLDPAKEGVITRTAQIVTELRALGFDEVMFFDFRYPETDQIIITGGEPADNLQAAAQALVDACSSETFAVSFYTTDPNFVLPEGRCRLYLDNVPAADIAWLVNNYGLTDQFNKVVFMAQSEDTRYREYSILQPFGS